MIKFECEFECQTEQEVIYALQEIMSQLEGGYSCGHLCGADGSWSYEGEEEEEEDKEEDVNYVIIQDNGEPVVWSYNNLPVIYGGVKDAEMDLQEGDKIVTLGEYAKSINKDWKSVISE